MPARGFVWRCSRLRKNSRSGWCAQRGCRTSSIQRPFWPPSGRSHRASLFGMSCISALVCLVLQRWAARFAEAARLHWLHWSQTRRSDGVIAAAFCSGSFKTSGTMVAHSSRAYVKRLTRTSVCVLASVFGGR